MARVATVQNTNAWVKAGVMIRADVSAGSAQAMMMVTPGKGNNFQRRPTAGGASVGTAGLMVTAPSWVKLTRVGTLVTAYQSIDGTTWSQVGTQTIAMPASVLVGLAVSSHSTTTLATATFDQVAIASAPPPVNDPPTVALTAPAPEARYTAPASIQLTADASDSDGGIQQVDFFAGSTPIGSATTAPYSVTWTNVAAGSYTLTARALDTGGATTTSSGVHVVVNPPATGLPSPWLTQDVGAVGKPAARRHVRDRPVLGDRRGRRHLGRGRRVPLRLPVAEWRRTDRGEGRDGPEHERVGQGRRDDPHGSQRGLGAGDDDGDARQGQQLPTPADGRRRQREHDWRDGRRALLGEVDAHREYDRRIPIERWKHVDAGRSRQRS